MEIAKLPLPILSQFLKSLDQEVMSWGDSVFVRWPKDSASPAETLICEAVQYTLSVTVTNRVISHGRLRKPQSLVRCTCCSIWCVYGTFPREIKSALIFPSRLVTCASAGPETRATTNDIARRECPNDGLRDHEGDWDTRPTVTQLHNLDKCVPSRVRPRRLRAPGYGRSQIRAALAGAVPSAPADARGPADR
jgi:hypothetical protein